MNIADLYNGARVSISGPGVTISGRVIDIVHVDRPACVVIHVWTDGEVAGSITVPSGSEHLVTIRDLDEMEPTC